MGRAGTGTDGDPTRRPQGAKSGTYTGLWLTDLGLMELTQVGTKVEGIYAMRGTSKIEGKVVGRRLDFRFQSFRDGQGWFDLTVDGKSFAGAGNAEGFPGWFSSKGEPGTSFTRHASLVPGKIVTGSTRNLFTYSVRALEDYRADSSRKWPIVLILHGSNRNSQSCVATIAAVWPDIAARLHPLRRQRRDAVSVWR